MSPLTSPAAGAQPTCRQDADSYWENIWRAGSCQKAKVTLSRPGWGASQRLNYSLALFAFTVILSNKKCAARA